MAGRRDLSTLERRLDRVAERLTDGVQEMVGAVIEEIGNEVVSATPVLTGFARANWRPSLNAPITDPVSFLDHSGAATISRIVTVARRWKVGDTAFIVNHAPYIGELNAGSSPQAPAGFVKDATARGVTAGIQKRAREIV